MFILYFALAAFVGGIIAALIGWMGSGAAFDAKTFLSSVLRAFVAAAGGAAAGIWVEPTTAQAMIIGILAALVSGAGIDVLGNRVSKAVAVRMKVIK